MHFTTLFVLKDEDIENINLSYVEEVFGKRFCYSCGETVPMYRYWCDWFQIGGRWCDLLSAKRGIVGERSWANKEDKQMPNKFSIVNIKDLEEPIDKSWIYAVATKSKIYEADYDEDKYNQLIDKINAKAFNGVIALIDCHD